MYRNIKIIDRKANLHFRDIGQKAYFDGHKEKVFYTAVLF